MNARLLSSIMCAMTLICLVQSPLNAQDRNLQAVKTAQEEFAKQHYPQALEILRNHLREHPQDQDAWVWFGASYYHTGQAQLALTTLSKAKPKGDLKALRRYYMALSYDALGKSEKAKTLLKAQARSKDLLAEDALFELTVIQFEEGDASSAEKHINDYNKRFPNGRYEKQMATIKGRLTEAGHSEVAGSRRAQYKASYFENTPLALISFPHLWFYEIGYDYLRGSRANPGYKNGLPIVQTGASFETYKLTTQFGFILGPFKGTGTQSHAGYVYSQNWFSDAERIETYTRDLTDFQYFPFRPDLMERTHRLFVETQGNRGSFNFGAYGHWAYVRAGSDLFPAPERPEIRKSFDLGLRTLFVPWAEWLYHPQHKLRFHLTFEKNLNREQDDYSFKTYNFSSSSEEPFLSYTVQNESRFSFLDIKLKEEFYQHRYLFNDYWESYTATGFAGQIQARLGSNIHLMVAMGLADQNFSSEVIRSQACTDIGSDFSGDPGTSVICKRSDKITKFAAGASYVNNSQQSFAAIFRKDDRKNDKLVVYNESNLEVLFVFTHAFPNLLGVERFIEPFVGLADQRGVF